MIGPLGRLRAAAALRQHCPQMTQRRCMALEHIIHRLDNVAKLVRPWLPYNMDTENENERKESHVTQ